MSRRSLTFALALIVAAAVAAPGNAAAQGKPVETVIQAKGPSGPLAATMLAPAPGAPVVVVVPGSGPTDRDGNSPNGVRPSTYRLLAEGLAARGITTVRIDKRGMFGSRAAIADPNAVTIDDYAADIRTWAATIRERTGASCVWVLGHSEGGLVALVAAQNLPDLCGLVLVSTAGRPLGAVLREQLQSNPANAPVLDQALAAIARLEAGQRVDVSGMNPALLPLFYPAVQGFLINALSFDPAQLIATCRQPVLILQGQRDIQVAVGDAERLAQANSDAKLVLVPDTNHVLKTVTSDDRRANLATYMNPDLPLAPGVIDPIANFIMAAKVR